MTRSTRRRPSCREEEEPTGRIEAEKGGWGGGPERGWKVGKSWKGGGAGGASKVEKSTRGPWRVSRALCLHEFDVETRFAFFTAPRYSQGVHAAPAASGLLRTARYARWLKLNIPTVGPSRKP
ncbi:hypothetical protein KM043_005565 [Ampulex compressa]|nr:hypothetical protein KM043_005565 [Ampulex compressa]